MPTITTVNPATGLELTSYDTHDEAALDAAIGGAHAAYVAWAAATARASAPTCSARSASCSPSVVRTTPR